MADVLTTVQRSFNMSRIRGRDTKPELVVRRMLHAAGYRFRLHSRNLPGKPDLVFASRRKVVFVHGCFWHRHACKAGRVTPATNAMFWLQKIGGNVTRDEKCQETLRKSGWRVLVIWECETRDRPRLAKRLRRFLGT